MPRLSTKGYNTTDLDPLTAFERNIFHRDQFAHYFRWSHVLKTATPLDRVIDFGCGRGNLLEVLWRNYCKPASYVGLDIRQQTIEKDVEKFATAARSFPVAFEVVDLVRAPMETFVPLNGTKVVSFEVIEHVGKCNVQPFLERFAACGGPGATYFVSTPNFNGKAAGNHTYDAGDGEGEQPQEWEHYALQAEFYKAGFVVRTKYGTFASQRDYKSAMSPTLAFVYEQLKSYYDATLTSCIMAPLVDAALARNCLWVLERA